MKGQVSDCLSHNLDGTPKDLASKASIQERFDIGGKLAGVLCIGLVALVGCDHCVHRR